MGCDDINCSTLDEKIKAQLYNDKAAFMDAVQTQARRLGLLDARRQEKLGDDRAHDFDDELEDEDSRESRNIEHAISKFRTRTELELYLLEDLVLDLKGMPGLFLDEL